MQMHIIQMLHLRHLQPLSKAQVQNSKICASTFVLYLVAVTNNEFPLIRVDLYYIWSVKNLVSNNEFHLVGVDAPVVDVKGPGARHPPVVDVLHRVQDFHLRKITIISCSKCWTV